MMFTYIYGSVHVMRMIDKGVSLILHASLKVSELMEVYDGETVCLYFNIKNNSSEEEDALLDMDFGHGF